MWFGEYWINKTDSEKYTVSGAFSASLNTLKSGWVRSILSFFAYGVVYFEGVKF